MSPLEPGSSAATCLQLRMFATVPPPPLLRFPVSSASFSLSPLHGSQTVQLQTWPLFSADPQWHGLIAGTKMSEQITMSGSCRENSLGNKLHMFQRVGEVSKQGILTERKKSVGINS